MKSIMNIQEAKDFVKSKDFTFLYISSEGCNVCKILLPKVEAILTNYPNIESRFIDIDSIPEASGEFSVFSVPVMLLFIEGKETIRESRYVSLDDFENKVNKYYSMFY